MNINDFLFTRTAPKRKMEVVKSLSDRELMAITPQTLLRCIKEAGDNWGSTKRSRMKRLFARGNPGNDWNSEVEYIYNGKKDKLYLSVYIQGDSTDTSDDCPIETFLDFSREEVICARIEESWDYGYSHTLSARYDREQRCEVLRSLLKSYLLTKYKDKL